MTGKRSWSTTWSFNGQVVSAREFHRLLSFGECPPAPAEIRCSHCRHLLYYRLVDLRKDSPYVLWRPYMWLMARRMELARRLAPSCEQCRFDRRVRGWR